MCDYCDCRTRPLLAQLGEDHERIGVLSGQLLRELDAGDEVAAVETASRLSEILQPHSDLEEHGLYLELAEQGVETGRLFADHAAIDEVFRAASLGHSDAWAAVPAAAAALADHIEREEYDLFPAAHQLLSDPAWDRIEVHRHQHQHAAATARDQTEETQTR